MSLPGISEQPAPNEYEIVDDITAKCNKCNWQATGPIKAETISGTIIPASELLKLCKGHQIHDGNQFNQFNKYNKSVGFAAVSSAGSTGIYNRPIITVGNK